MSKPIKPSEIAAAKTSYIPEIVFDVFNELIANKYTSGRAIVLQKDVVGRLVAAGLSNYEIFHNGYLNVEEAYRAEGWSVKYDKPAYNESYDASFEFKG